MTLGEVCSHGSLKRQCLICEYEEKLRLANTALQKADDLAKATVALQITEGHYYEDCSDDQCSSLCLNAKKALAAYQAARGMNNLPVGRL